MAKWFDVQAVFSHLSEILAYLPVTRELAVISMLIAVILGLILAVIKINHVPVLTAVVNVFVSVIRGTPIIVQLYITYFGIPMVLKYISTRNGTEFQSGNVPGIFCAIVALSVNESAYIAEIFRGALQSVGTGQIEAANALGMTYFQALRRIILPETLTVALPGLGNSFIGLIKGTSLAFTCAVVEITAQGKIIGGRTYRYFEVYVSLALIYWVVTIVVEQLVKLLERKNEIPENAALVTERVCEAKPGQRI
ncbi:MAG: amino acid ABC transporter permease [Lachnospiraceae bacterium]|nr:amino acid ABC transporter permease [Lachnospiraceae bacterium]